MMNAEKFQKAIDYIYNHIDQSITLKDIAHHIGISVASLKRLFNDAIAQSPGNFIRRLRMELALRSLQDREKSILEIALNSGFDDHSAFTRRFKEIFGYPPSQGREKINITKELEYIELDVPEIVELEDKALQGITVVGRYFESAPKAWNQLQEKLHPDELTDDFGGIFIGIGHDNPHEGQVAEKKVRFSACVASIERELNIEKIVIKGGRYAKFRYTGKVNNLGLAYHTIFGQWQEKSSFKIDHSKPVFLVFENIPSFKNQNVIIYVPTQE